MIISTLHGSESRIRVQGHADRDELNLIADYLDVIRQFSPRSPSISDETASELEQYLALAEAALRRASAEISLGDSDLPASKIQ
ncbi:MAG: hypothetical protein AAFZ74_17915 [Pseudomonadota bacterium]